MHITNCLLHFSVPLHRAVSKQPLRSDDYQSLLRAAVKSTAPDVAVRLANFYDVCMSLTICETGCWCIQHHLLVNVCSLTGGGPLTHLILQKRKNKTGPTRRSSRDQKPSPSSIFGRRKNWLNIRFRLPHCGHIVSAPIEALLTPSH